MEEGRKLGFWVAGQRRGYITGTLSKDRESRLASLPKWTWTPFDTLWSEYFTMLQQFAVRHGHARVPRYFEQQGLKLGQWVNSQRNAYWWWYRSRQHDNITGRSPGRMDRERQHRLESLPGWTWSTEDSAWQKNYERLKQFIQSEGHAIVPESYALDGGTQLGAWLKHQRSLNRKGRLAPDRQLRLEALRGWTWASDGSRGRGSQVGLGAWEQHLDELRRYVDRVGDARVPGRFVAEDGSKLGSWVSNQRTRHRTGVLDADRERQLV